MDKKRLIRILQVIGLLLAIAVLECILRIPSVLIFKEYRCFILCIYKIHCPGCGGTRMLKALMHGKLYQAFRYNPFMFITMPFIGTYIIYNMILYIRKGRLDKYFNQVFIVYVVLVLAWFIVRNMRGMEFLLPTVI